MRSSKSLIRYEMENIFMSIKCLFVTKIWFLGDEMKQTFVNITDVNMKMIGMKNRNDRYEKQFTALFFHITFK